MWLNFVGAQGNVRAHEQRDAIAALMSRVQIIEAQRAASPVLSSFVFLDTMRSRASVRLPRCDVLSRQVLVRMPRWQHVRRNSLADPATHFSM